MTNYFNKEQKRKVRKEEKRIHILHTNRASYKYKKKQLQKKWCYRKPKELQDVCDSANYLYINAIWMISREEIRVKTSKCKKFRFYKKPES